MSAFWWWRYWSHWWSLKDATDHDYFNPTSLHSRDCKLTTWGVWNRCIDLCINFWNHHFILNTDAVKLLVFPMHGTPHSCYPTWRRRTLLYKLTSKDSWEWSGFGQPPVWKCWAVKILKGEWHLTKGTKLCINVEELLLSVLFLTFYKLLRKT